MNKPTKRTVDDLREALNEIAHVRAAASTPSLDLIESRVRGALDQLTRDDMLPCPRCTITKPTRRALSAHVSMTHGGVS